MAPLQVKQAKTMIAPMAAAASPSKATTCFVYGTLMAPEVLKGLLGRVPSMLRKVTLRNHIRHPVVGKHYPGVIPSRKVFSLALNKVRGDSSYLDRKAVADNDSVEGALLLEISPLEMKCLDYFEEEGVDYTRSRVEVHVPLDIGVGEPGVTYEESAPNYPSTSTDSEERSSWKSVSTNAYIWARDIAELDLLHQWDYEAFRKNHLMPYVENIVKPCRIEIKDLILESDSHHLLTTSNESSISTDTSTCFVYGTLQSPEVLQGLLGRVPRLIHNVILPNHRRHPVLGRQYPGVIPSTMVSGSASAASTEATLRNGNSGKNLLKEDNKIIDISTVEESVKCISDSVEGVLLLEISPLEMKYLDYYEEEGVFNGRLRVQVQVPCESSTASTSYLEKGSAKSPSPTDESPPKSSRCAEKISDWKTVSTNSHIWACDISELDLLHEWDYEAKHL